MKIETATQQREHRREGLGRNNVAERNGDGRDDQHRQKVITKHPRHQPHHLDWAGRADAADHGDFLPSEHEMLVLV